MPFKRDREEDEAPVVVRGGAGVEALTGGRNITIDTLAAEMEKMTKKIDAYVTEVAEKNKQIEVKNQQIEEKDKQVVKMAIQIEERNQKMAAMSTANQMHEVQLNQEHQAAKEVAENERKATEKYEFLEKEHAVLKRMLKDQATTIQQLKQSAGQSTPEPQGQPQSNKSLNQQLNEARNERSIQGRHLDKARQRIAELERALASNNSPASVLPPCTHNSQDFITRVAHERINQAAQKEISNRIAANKGLQDQVKNAQIQARNLAKELREKNAGINRCQERIDKLEDEASEAEKNLTELQEDNESWEARITELNESCDVEVRNLRDKCNWYISNTVALEAYNNAITENTQLKSQLAEQTVQHDSGEKDEEIKKLQAQVHELEHIVANTEKACAEKIQGCEEKHRSYEVQIQGYNTQIHGYETQINETRHLATTKVGQLEEQISTLHGEVAQRTEQISTLHGEVAQRKEDIVGLTNRLNTETAEKGRLSQEVTRLTDQSATYQHQVSGEQQQSTELQEQYEKAHSNVSKLRRKVKKLQATLAQYEAEVRAHVCAPAQEAPPSPPRTPTTDYTWWPEEVDELDAHFKKLSLNNDDGDGDVAKHNQTVIDRHAPAPAAVTITFTSSTPAKPTSSLLSTTPTSLPPAAPATIPLPIPNPPPTPPTSPPQPPTAPTQPAKPYDAREDVPDIDSWWYDREQFTATWQGATFEYRRAKPFCDNCRTRRALRLVDGEWKKPADFHRKIPCPEHAKWWYPEDAKPWQQQSCWKEDCPACIEADARVSGEEDRLPELLRERYRCCSPNCTDYSAREQAKARFLLAEIARFKAEYKAAWWVHQEHLQKYRAVYGSQWPYYKGEERPEGFVPGAVSYGRRCAQ